MNKKEAFEEINRIQDEYVDELIRLINSSEYASMKMINFTSPTGTGKTKMMSKLINKMPEYYFVITTLSKGQLHVQVRNNLLIDCKKENFTVYGSADYKINSKLDAQDIIGRIPKGIKCVWLRDEGHIKTSRFDELLANVCYKIINFSATNTHSDIQCNFTQTMMLRTVNQIIGSPREAIDKLLEIKESHKDVLGYNPCAIFRCISAGKEELHEEIVRLCEENNLKHIDISEDFYTMSELCEDDNEYDVIINKFKIVEGIDIRRAHVLYMDNQPNNNATTIQVIGRCRRNALLYRDDIDILAPQNQGLLKNTRECFVYYKEQMKIDEDENGELQYAFCNYVSCESLKAGSTIEVIKGQLSNGLYILELEGKTGLFHIIRDEQTGFNIVDPLIDFYKTITQKRKEYLYFGDWSSNDKGQHKFYKVNAVNVSKFPVDNHEEWYDSLTESFKYVECAPYYRISLYSPKPEKMKDLKKMAFGKGEGDISAFYDSYEDLFEEVDKEELSLLKKGYLKAAYCCFQSYQYRLTGIEEHNYNYYRDCSYPAKIPVDDFNSWRIMNNYEKTVNDKESAIIGTDLMHQIKNEDNDVVWTESKSVSAKIGGYTKLNTFISNQYKKELEQAKQQCFSGKNDFNLDKRCNSIVGYCVEYYSKYLIYGEQYIEKYLREAENELDKKRARTKLEKECVIVRACMLKYKDMMALSFGYGVSKLIRGISAGALRENYYDFVNVVVELGTRTAEFVRKVLYPDGNAENNIDPNLSIKHISGLADYITEDTILDVKVRNNIDEKCVRQVLCYHYLSTKRSDLNIKRVIVYDATSDRAVVVNISKENLKNSFNMLTCEV